MGARLGRQLSTLCCCRLCGSSRPLPSANRKFRNSRTNSVTPAKPEKQIIQERFAMPEGTYNVKLGDEKNVIINSSVFLPTGDIVLSDMVNKRLKLYTCNFDIITYVEFPIPAMQLAASPNVPLMYAAFPDRVRQLHIDGGSLRRSGFIKTPGVCRGMAINKFDGKAISFSSDDDKGQVNLLTPGGNLQLEITQDQDGREVFKRPEQLAVTRDLVVLVVDRPTHRVIGVAHDGTVVFRYTGVRSPTAVACDELNYIYVAGQNSVHQLTDHGELVKLFLTKAEIGFSPLSMSYNPRTKMLLLTGKGSKVKLFKLINMRIPGAS